MEERHFDFENYYNKLEKIKNEEIDALIPNSNFTYGYRPDGDSYLRGAPNNQCSMMQYSTDVAHKMNPSALSGQPCNYTLVLNACNKPTRKQAYRYLERNVFHKSRLLQVYRNTPQMTTLAQAAKAVATVDMSPQLNYPLYLPADALKLLYGPACGNLRTKALLVQELGRDNDLLEEMLQTAADTTDNQTLDSMHELCENTNLARLLKQEDIVACVIAGTLQKMSVSHDVNIVYGAPSEETVAIRQQPLQKWTCVNGDILFQSHAQKIDFLLGFAGIKHVVWDKATPTSIAMQIPPDVLALIEENVLVHRDMNSASADSYTPSPPLFPRMFWRYFGLGVRFDYICDIEQAPVLVDDIVKEQKKQDSKKKVWKQLKMDGEQGWVKKTKINT